MGLTSKQRLGDIKNQLSSLTADEIKILITYANKEIERKDELRKKELWGNVVAAIKKYEKETDSRIYLDDGTSGIMIAVEDCNLSNPGYIYYE